MPRDRTGNGEAGGHARVHADATAIPESPFATATHAGIDALLHRAELAALETGESWDHLLMTCVLAGLAGLFCMLAGFAVTLAVAMLVRNLAAGWVIVAGVGLLYLIVAVSIFVGVRTRLRQWRPFETIREQLRKDGECLKSLMNGSTN